MNAETFKVWCDEYKERLRIEREANQTEVSMKLTGRQLFEKNKHAFEDLTLESNDESKASEEVKDE